MKEKIVRHSKEEIEKIKGKTSFKKVAETSDKDIEEQVKNDPDLVLPDNDELNEFKPVREKADEQKKKKKKLLDTMQMKLKKECEAPLIGPK